MQRKRNEGKIFSETETQYLKKPGLVKKGSRFTIKRRIRKKFISLSEKSIAKGLFLLTEEERYKIVHNFFLMLKPSTIRKLIRIYKKFEKERDKKLDIIKKWDEPDKLKQEKEMYEKTDLLLNLYLLKKTNPIKNKKAFEEKLKRFFNHPNTIFKAKVTSDRRYICNSKSTKTIYKTIKRFKRPIIIKGLFSKFKLKNEREIIFEFYRKGIILDEDMNQEDFKKICELKINSRNFSRNVKSDWVEYEIELFKIGKNFQDKKIVLNPLYKKIDFKYYSN